MEKLKVTMEDIQRFKILMEVIDRKLRVFCTFNIFSSDQ